MEGVSADPPNVVWPVAPYGVMDAVVEPPLPTGVPVIWQVAVFKTRPLGKDEAPPHERICVPPVQVMLLGLIANPIL